MTTATVYELKADYDYRASFYGKAQVIIEGNRKTLQSYSTQVAYIEKLPREPFAPDGVCKAVVRGTYSVTTLRHIKEFLLQNGFKAENKTQIMKDYCNN